MIKPLDDVLVDHIGSMDLLAGITVGFDEAVAVVQSFVAEAFEVGKRVRYPLPDLSLDTVLVVLGALGEDVLDAAGLAVFNDIKLLVFVTGFL